MEENKEVVETENTEKVEKKLGFGAGLGIGLAIGAIVLTAVVATMIMADRKNKDFMEATVLDSATIEKAILLEKVIDGSYYDYKDDPISQEMLREGLLKGVVDALDDPYSEYYTKEELEDTLQDNRGISFFGIGAYISEGDMNYPVLSGIKEDSPAEHAGLHAEDVIYKIDGVSAYGYTKEDAANSIRGEDGTVVHLTIYREGEEDYLEFDITRGPVETETVGSAILEDNIGYIRISEFDAVTIEQFQKNYQSLRDANVSGLILDLRSNPGGLFVTALEVCNMILPEGLVVYTEDKHGQRREFMCDGAGEIDIPLVVLVNGYTASAAEIVTGAIKDYGIGTIVGTTTFGKGIVQDIHTFEDGTAVKLTEKAYFTPNGHYIQGMGIEPDVLIEFDANKYYDEGIDNQLEKGLSIIKESM